MPEKQRSIRQNIKLKVSLEPFQRLAGSRDSVTGRTPQSAELSCTKSSTRGELQNSPVDCFERGDALR